MKLWKVILGIFTFIGGIFAISASTKKKAQDEADLRIKENEELTKKIKEAAKKVEEAKEKTKEELIKAKKKTSSTKKKAKDTTSAKKTVENFEDKYRKG
jgi:Skp family chaperone for outer membrane proteins